MREGRESSLFASSWKNAKRGNVEVVTPRVERGGISDATRASRGIQNRTRRDEIPITMRRISWISVRTDGNLKILRIYVSNFSARPAQSRGQLNRDPRRYRRFRSANMPSNNLRGVSVPSDAICATRSHSGELDYLLARVAGRLLLLPENMFNREEFVDQTLLLSLLLS